MCDGFMLLHYLQIQKDAFLCGDETFSVLARRKQWFSCAETWATGMLCAQLRGYTLKKP